MTTEHISTDAAASAAEVIRPGLYRLDPNLSTLAFSARKFGLFTVRGTMDVVEGTFTVAEPLECSSLHAVLAANTFRTPMAKRDKHVKGRNLLDVTTYPVIEFDSTSLSAIGSEWEIHGLLSVHGTVAPVVLLLTTASARDRRVYADATARIDRRDFGVTGMRAVASSFVDVRISAVGIPLGGSERGESASDQPVSRQEPGPPAQRRARRSD